MSVAKEIKIVNFKLYDGGETVDAYNLLCYVCGRFAINVARGKVNGLRKAHVRLHQEFKNDSYAWQTETYKTPVQNTLPVSAE